MYRFLSALIILLQLISLSADAITARSAVLIDASSGRVLYEHNAYQKLPMASTTKIMTGLLACQSGKLNQTVKTSPFASGTEGSSLWLKIGEKQTLENLTYGLMLKSGNDAAVSIAEYLGGNVDAFALLMNEKAREIGAINTNFKNPHGLDEEGHYTTAYDLALISREAMKNNKFRQIVSTKTYSIPMEGEEWRRALKNHNKLLWRYDGCNGVKTGFTKKCGRCLVSSAKIGNQELICVTLNAPDDWNDHTYLLDYGFENFRTKTIAKKGEKASYFTYDKDNNREVKLLYGDNYKIAVSKRDVIKTEIEYAGVSAPAKKGTVAGYMNVYCNGEKIDTIKLEIAEEIKKLTIFEKIMNSVRKLIAS